MPPAGLILAGGLSRRMGQDKALLPFPPDGTLLGCVAARLRGRVAPLLINANGDKARFIAFGVPVIADDLPDHPGPLAGIVAGMAWLRGAEPDCRWLVSAPADTPFLPDDLVPRLLTRQQESGADVVVAASAGRLHRVVALWRTDLELALRHHLANGHHALRDVEDVAQIAAAEWPDDPFLNINTPEALARAMAARGT